MFLWFKNGGSSVFADFMFGVADCFWCSCFPTSNKRNVSRTESWPWGHTSIQQPSRSHSEILKVSTGKRPYKWFCCTHWIFYGPMFLSLMFWFKAVSHSDFVAWKVSPRMQQSMLEVVQTQSLGDRIQPGPRSYLVDKLSPWKVKVVLPLRTGSGHPWLMWEINIWKIKKYDNNSKYLSTWWKLQFFFHWMFLSVWGGCLVFRDLTSSHRLTLLHVSCWQRLNWPLYLPAWHFLPCQPTSSSSTHQLNAIFLFVIRKSQKQPSKPNISVLELS